MPADPTTQRSAAAPQTFKLLARLYGDDEMAEVFSETETIEGWLRVEAELALAQADADVITHGDAKAIAGACTLANIDTRVLWEQTRIVGYPILPLIRMIGAALPPGPAGRVHYGATTQDIMDTALALQLDRACLRLTALLVGFGDALARLTEEHVDTVIAARTHAQQAVPTTFGAKLAAYLGELARHRERLETVRQRVRTVSLFGAGGTSAALGERAPAVRRALATRLGLEDTEVPWHVARDNVADFGTVCAMVAATSGRFAREVIDLSRTEIDEVREADGHGRGASSTMPQKANSIGSEAVVGMAATAGALSSAVFRAMEAGHERAAGEWQIEWYAVPLLAELAAGAMGTAAEIAVGLRVFPETMRANLDADGGLIMAEAYMMRLADTLGRERAHDLVYEAARVARAEGRALDTTLREVASPGELAGLNGSVLIPPQAYVGDPRRTCAAALKAWRTMERAS